MSKKIPLGRAHDALGTLLKQLNEAGGERAFRDANKGDVRTSREWFAQLEKTQRMLVDWCESPEGENTFSIEPQK